MSAPNLGTPNYGSWVQGIWTDIGSYLSWGLSYFLTGLLTMIFPFGTIATFVTWVVKALAYVLTPMFANTALSGVVTFLTGNDLQDLLAIVEFLIGWVMHWPLFYWLFSGLFWWWVYCITIRFTLVIYHQFWGAD